MIEFEAVRGKPRDGGVVPVPAASSGRPSKSTWNVHALLPVGTMISLSIWSCIPLLSGQRAPCPMLRSTAREGRPAWPSCSTCQSRTARQSNSPERQRRVR